MRVLENYINGAWVKSSGTTLLDVKNPATGELLAKVPSRPRATSTPPSRPRRRRSPAGPPRPSPRRALPLQAQGPLRRAQGRDRRHLHLRARQDAERVSQRFRPRDRERGARRGDAHPPDGTEPLRHLERHRHQRHPPAARRLRGDHALQLPADGAALVHPLRHRLGEHLRPQALGASPADAAPDLRAD